MADFAYELCHCRIGGVCPPASCPTTGRRNRSGRSWPSCPPVGPGCLPCCCGALRQAEELGLQWRDLNFAAAAPAVTVRQGKGDRSRVVPAHPELMDAFRSVPRGRANDSVFHFSARTAARWIMQAAPRQAVARFNVRRAIIGLIARRSQRCSYRSGKRSRCWNGFLRTTEFP